MTMYEEKHMLYQRYVSELNESFSDERYRIPEEDAREDCDEYICDKDATWKNIFSADGKLVGFLIIGKGGDERHPDSIRSVAQAYVLPEYRRQGLMTAALADYESRHRGVWSLLVIWGNTAAKAFWEKRFAELGYTPVSLDTGYVRDDLRGEFCLLGFRPKGER